jgi:transcriptional regulator with XRE-family HTH domain
VSVLVKVYLMMIAEVNIVNPKNNLAHLRRQRGLTQARLCVLTGLHPSTVSRIETGVIKGGSSIRRRIARALKVELVEVFPISGDGRR